ncbi:MAG: hypothetical protein COB17_02260 [Sulfurimonas sp.]|nr:MAG: hypothetical protein COB17_02260 [Sulfurimonas sp.]
MKNIIFLFTSISLLMLSGCGGEGDVSSASNGTSQTSSVAEVQTSSISQPQSSSISQPQIGGFPSIPSLPKG